MKQWGKLKNILMKQLLISLDRQGRDVCNKQVTLGARPDLTSGRVDRQVGALGISKNAGPGRVKFFRIFRLRT